MIVISNNIADSSDAVSTTNTLVTNGRIIPHHFLKLVYASLFISIVAFIFSMVDGLDSDPTFIVPNGIVATILAFIFTLPHHCAIFLLRWPQRYQISNILPFKPCSVRAVVYSVFLVGLWTVSTAVCARSLHNVRIVQINPLINPPSSNNAMTIASSAIVGSQRDLSDYWMSLALTLTSAMELIFISAITLFSYL